MKNSHSTALDGEDSLGLFALAHTAASEQVSCNAWMYTDVQIKRQQSTIYTIRKPWETLLQICLALCSHLMGPEGVGRC